jgi:hypothetical protein
MNNTKASQSTTRRDIPSAKRLLEARATALQPKDRPSGICRTTPTDTAHQVEEEPEGDEPQEKVADSPR